MRFPRGTSADFQEEFQRIPERILDQFPIKFLRIFKSNSKGFPGGIPEVFLEEYKRNIWTNSRRIPTTIPEEFQEIGTELSENKNLNTKRISRKISGKLLRKKILFIFLINAREISGQNSEEYLKKLQRKFGRNSRGTYVDVSDEFLEKFEMNFQKSSRRISKKIRLISGDISDQSLEKNQTNFEKNQTNF